MRTEHSLVHNLFFLTTAAVLLSGCTLPHRLKSEFVTVDGCVAPERHATAPRNCAANYPNSEDSSLGLRQPLSPDTLPRRSSANSKSGTTPSHQKRPADPVPSSGKGFPADGPAEPLILQPELMFDNAVVFHWQKSPGGKSVYTNSKGPASFPLKMRGAAAIGDAGRMELSGGSVAVENVNDRLLAAAMESNELTIEIALNSSKEQQRGPARILSFSSNHNSRNFTVGQEQNHLILRLRTSQNDQNGTSPELTLAELDAGTPTHIVVTYKSGTTVCWVNGEKSFESDKLTGDFSNWEPHHVILGDEWNGQRDWSGTIDLVRISTSFADEPAATRLFDLWQSKSRQR